MMRDSQPIESSTPVRKRRHHHRAWQHRLQRAVFPATQPWRSYIIVAVLLSLLAILLGLAVAHMASQTAVSSFLF